jgi:hypothetical protein
MATKRERGSRSPRGSDSGTDGVVVLLLGRLTIEAFGCAARDESNGVGIVGVGNKLMDFYLYKYL